MWSRTTLLVLVAAAVTGCTQSVPSQFKLLPANDTVNAGYAVKSETITKTDTKVDVLWVVDNSASMSNSQAKLRDGLSNFASKFLTKSSDIQIGVITTDTFLANDLWAKYLDTPIEGRKETPKTYTCGDKAGCRPHPEWGSDYAMLSSSDLLSTKSTSGLASRFKSLVSVGIRGIYEEHGFDSVKQFLADNEKSGSAKAHPLFRKGSQRLIVFLSDEDDQSMDASSVGPEPRKLLYSGSYYVGKDEAQANKILPAHFTIDCPASTVDGVTLEPMSTCVRPGLVSSVESFKSDLDSFFRGLDSSSGAPNYMIVSIVGKDLKTIQSLRKDDGTDITHERGERYIQLADQVGNGSFSMDIGAEDYSPILSKIGLEIQSRSVSTEFSPQSKITLDRAPDTREPVYVVVAKADGSQIDLKPSQYTLSGNILTITDQAFLKTLKEGDRVFVRSQPSTVKPASQS